MTRLRPVSGVVYVTNMYAIRTIAMCTSLTLALAACDGQPSPTTASNDPEPSGAELVVGSSIDEWTLLSVPKRGGPAELRSLSDPATVLWSGRVDIPVVVAAHALQDGPIVLRSDSGDVFAYQRVSDEVLHLDSIAPASEWIAYGSSGVYLDRDAGEVLHISHAGTWRYTVSDPILWASPLDDETVGLLVRSASGTRLLILQRAETTPAEESGAALTGPGVALAWGRRLALVSDDRYALRFVTIAPITEVASVDLPGKPTAIAASPSSHEVYIAVDNPPRLVAVNRFNQSRRDLGRFQDAIREIRPSLLGESLLVWDGRRAWHVAVAGTGAVPLEADWRADLPLGLPGGRILASRGEQLLMLDVAGREDPLEPSADRFWLPVHGDAAGQTIVADEIRGRRVADSTRIDAEGREVVLAPASRADDDGFEDGAGLDPTDGGLDPTDGTIDASASPPSDPPGFYAIVGSARQQSGITDLVESLASSGYPTRVQSFPDDAGDIWYRGLVGPYRTRPEADAAARQLTRERKLQAWVTEIGADVLR